LSDSEYGPPSGSALPVVDLITTKADIDLCLGSGELLPCPFCGHWAMSAGEKTKSGRGVLWTISCTNTTHLFPDCCASVWAVDEDQAKARSKAVARWNRRPNPQVHRPGSAGYGATRVGNESKGE
jgi:hypothetical protein